MSQRFVWGSSAGKKCQYPRCHNQDWKCWQARPKLRSQCRPKSSTSSKTKPWSKSIFNPKLGTPGAQKSQNQQPQASKHLKKKESSQNRLRPRGCPSSGPRRFDPSMSRAPFSRRLRVSVQMALEPQGSEGPWGLGTCRASGIGRLGLSIQSPNQGSLKSSVSGIEQLRRSCKTSPSVMSRGVAKQGLCLRARGVGRRPSALWKTSCKRL